MAHSADSLPLKLPSSLFPLGSGQLQVRRRPWASLLLTDTGNACRSPGMAPRLSPCFPLSLHPFGFCLRPVLGGGLFCPCQQKSGRAVPKRAQGCGPGTPGYSLSCLPGPTTSPALLTPPNTGAPRPAAPWTTSRSSGRAGNRQVRGTQALGQDLYRSLSNKERIEITCNSPPCGHCVPGVMRNALRVQCHSVLPASGQLPFLRLVGKRTD